MCRRFDRPSIHEDNDICSSSLACRSCSGAALTMRRLKLIQMAFGGDVRTTFAGPLQYFVLSRLASRSRRFVQLRIRVQHDVRHVGNSLVLGGILFHGMLLLPPVASFVLFASEDLLDLPNSFLFALLATGTGGFLAFLACIPEAVVRVRIPICW